MVITAFESCEEDTRICEEPVEVDAELLSLEATAPQEGEAE